MNKIEKNILDEGLIFKGVRGSIAYGTNQKDSDTDYVGIYVQKDSDIVGLNYVPQISSGDNNCVYYELSRFLTLAMHGNPNILEVFNLPNDCIIYTTPAFELIKYHKDMFLTKDLHKTFTGYAKSQIKKAVGLNKKINYDKSFINRKKITDFCYVLTGNECSISLHEWLSKNNLSINSIGLSKVNNFPEIYSIYLTSEDEGGIVSEDSNDLQLRVISPISSFLTYLRVDKNAYSEHCKKHKEYSDWVKKRNQVRFQGTIDHGQKYDTKNMMHCVRLLGMAIDICIGNGIVVRRSEEELKMLMSILRGEYTYDKLLKIIENRVNVLESLFNDSLLPEKVDKNKVHSLINTVRRIHSSVRSI